ncbi:hypothetical protein LZC95_40870 [Pendulispora brunnea]|uniref:Uncharacterized protein n=1 Tax=Pendulispora brunnea TaxID=2905690 RepID=A0ABZ2K233_9BACT
MTPWWIRATGFVVALIAFRSFATWWCGRGAEAWFRGDAEPQTQLAADVAAFEQEDDPRQFNGKMALWTHQMAALGLAQVVFEHPERKAEYVPIITRAASKCFLPEMRGFGTEAWSGEDAFKSLEGSHAHGYLGGAALAISVARALDPAFPADVAKQHDALIAAFERRLLASPSGLVETFPHAAHPHDTAAIAGALAWHTRATGRVHTQALSYWTDKVRTKQIDPASGLLVQRMEHRNGRGTDFPRASGTALAAYYASYADRGIAALLREAVLRHASDLWGFGGVREYEDGHSGFGEDDDVPVLLGISPTATVFALAPARVSENAAEFTRLYRTTTLAGVPYTSGGRTRFLALGPIGNAVLLALLTARTADGVAP